MRQDFHRRSKQYLIFRLLIVLLGFGLVTFYQLCLEPGIRQHTSLYLYALLGTYLLLALTLLILYPRWRNHQDVIRWQVVADFVIQSLLVWGTGGVLSIFSPLLFVTLVAATSIISSREAFILASLATVVLVATTLAHGLGVVPVTSGRAGWLRDEKSVSMISYLLASVLALYAISTLGSRFSHGLRSMEGIQSEILENMAEGLIAVDHEGHVVQLNKEARELLGIQENRINYRKLDLKNLFPGDSYVFLREAFQEDRRRRFSTVITTVPSSKERPVEVKISSVYGDQQEPRFRIGLISDLTLKREVQAAERRIQKLEDLQVMALGIAHEIRNPLASIRGCVQEIKRLTKSSVQETRYMDIVCRESDRLDRIIEDFLGYARSGPVDLVPLDLLQVIEESILLLKSRHEFASRTLFLSALSQRPRIFGDRNRLTQVFLNLGLNAMEATSPRDGKIAIYLREKRFATMQVGALEGDLVPGIEVEISDNGSGIEAGDLKKVFTPFFTTKQSGNGLGLSIVGRIVREHLGVIDVSSLEGKGTTFRLWFPLMGKGKGEAGGKPEIARAKEETELHCHA